MSALFPHRFGDLLDLLHDLLRRFAIIEQLEVFQQNVAHTGIRGGVQILREAIALIGHILDKVQFLRARIVLRRAALDHRG